MCRRRCAQVLPERHARSRRLCQSVDSRQQQRCDVHRSRRAARRAHVSHWRHARHPAASRSRRERANQGLSVGNSNTHQAVQRQRDATTWHGPQTHEQNTRHRAICNAARPLADRSRPVRSRSRRSGVGFARTTSSRHLSVHHRHQQLRVVERRREHVRCRVRRASSHCNVHGARRRGSGRSRLERPRLLRAGARTSRCGACVANKRRQRDVERRCRRR
mmetsp:Transcript_17244/g.29970  ORF Transcript_17244/g.29970 Transcript_17244/m.29970 type:complete len:219 (+) Transcript_17244:1226-1882(+)